ncbi:LysR substrate-binding domain-containing protein [Massilia aquatica]|uniref:LysR substrate-binding domain-containing protein n=1 Tax=Massilia aquatica TaxID=2609000 RepID=A0ABX0M7M6_9BURK|nr:LysR substrate-binding domain-containing protein [Massilia aquatica]NHZ43198.1 hypothetical protein [Massilia aquatica]
MSWTQTASGDSVATTHSRQRIVTDNAAGMRSFALAGAGVAILPESLVRDDLAAGRLLRLLPGYALPEQGVYAVYPNMRHLPAKVGMFIAFLREFIGN